MDWANSQAEQFTGSKWEPVIDGEIYIVLGLFMLKATIQKSTLWYYFTVRRVIFIPCFRDIITTDGLKWVYRFLKFLVSYNIPVTTCPNNKLKKLYLPNKDIWMDKLLRRWKNHLSDNTFHLSHPTQDKYFELCDATPGYLWSFINTGKGTNCKHFWWEQTPTKHWSLS